MLPLSLVKKPPNSMAPDLQVSQFQSSPDLMQISSDLKLFFTLPDHTYLLLLLQNSIPKQVSFAVA